MASKVFTIICGVELGKPYVLPLSVGTPQGATTAQRVEEAAKSESQVVMTRIRTQH
jgi:hypothetical protein